MAIRVLLADDHRLLVEGFRHALKDLGVDVVDVAYSLDGLIDRYFEIKPDVLVIDIRFNRDSAAETGLDVCEAILERDPAARIVVFSQFDDQHLIENTYKIGALAFVRKDESTDVLLNAINTVAEGTEFFSPQVAQLLAWSFVKDRNPANLLDPKEMKLFIMTADGSSMVDIAKAMDLSSKTIGAMMKTIKEKLGIENPADFTKLAIRFGLTDTQLKTRS